LWKDQPTQARCARTRPLIAEHARNEYLSAWSLQHDPYPGINAATLSLLGDHAAARDLAQAVVGASRHREHCAPAGITPPRAKPRCCSGRPTARASAMPQRTR
jgi:hypothetical protein